MLDLEIYVDGLTDMHTIIREIRNAHKGDIDSAPSKTINEHFEEILEKAEQCKAETH